MILRLLDRDTYVEGVTMNYTNEWIDEIVQTHNAFKAREFSRNELLDIGSDIAEWVDRNETTMIEVVETL